MPGWGTKISHAPQLGQKIIKFIFKKCQWILWLVRCFKKKNNNNNKHKEGNIRRTKQESWVSA